ncbi:MAG: LysR family transcriptional regulator [Bdellovibrionota bacterium]
MITAKEKNVMSWRNVDLNLLIIFDALMSERNVTRAGKKVGLSQPAVSAALSKLRTSLNDELFIRESGGIRPTPRAMELSLRFKNVLTEIESALTEKEFNPLTKDLALKVEMDAYSQLVFLPKLHSFLAKEAPNVKIRLKSHIDGPRGEVQKFETDLAFTTENLDAGRNKIQDLFTDDYVIITKAPFSDTQLSMENLVSVPHIEVHGLSPYRIEIDRPLERNNLFRQVQFKIHSPMSALLMLQEGTLMCILPRRIAQMWAPQMGLRIHELPFDLPKIKLKMACMPSFNDCSFYEWLSSQFINKNL